VDQGRESDLIILNAGDVLDNALAVFTAACPLTNLPWLLASSRAVLIDLIVMGVTAFFLSSL